MLDVLLKTDNLQEFVSQLG